MKLHRDFYQRKLPHFLPKQGTFFLTYRLHGSIPKNVIEELALERRRQTKETEKNRQLERRMKVSYFNMFDNVLDKSLNEPYWLQNPLVAQIVQDSILYQDGKQYDLWVSSIMPNHVHSLLTLKDNSLNLDEILQRHKRFTARQSNKILHRTGQFWENETYDHVVKDEIEFQNTLNYILNNPVKAGFVKKWDDWKWNYINPILIEGYGPEIKSAFSG